VDVRDLSGYHNSLLDQIRVKTNENSSILSTALSNMPHMEPRLLQLYLQTYAITLFGYANVSLIMQGVMLEVLLKEIIFEYERKEFHGAFGTAIIHCDKKGYIEKKEIQYLTEFKDKIRNKYQHQDVEELTQGSSVKAYKIPLRKEDIAGHLVKSIQNVVEGVAEPPETITSGRIRPIDLIMKQAIDEKIYVLQYLQAAGFVKMMAEKHFPVKVPLEMS
jgi:hypothetical protein